MKTNSEINQAIARACGWKFVEGNRGKSPADSGYERFPITPIPDFCSSLDAMHEAEATLTDVQYKAYGKEIVMEATRLHGNGPELTYHRFILSCPALQRATAFCRVLNLETK